MRRAICGLMVGVAAALSAAELRVLPVHGTEAARVLPVCTSVPLAETELPGVCDLFLRVDALQVQVCRRAAARAFWLALANEEESVPSDAALRFYLEWLGRRYPFDRYGRFHLDRRFVLREEEELVVRFETFFRMMFGRTPLAKLPQAALEDYIPAVSGVPVFSGFEDDRYQKHDALILRLTAAFNANRIEHVGAAPGQAVVLPELAPAIVKALMIEESGGRGPRSLAAWEVDPLQVNVPGDWVEAKADLGLKKPERRNEGSLEGNLRAGIDYLARKGFGASGQAVSRRPGAYFDSWRTALQRYSGRTDPLHDGRAFRAAYAERVLRRAFEPGQFVPIARDRREGDR